MLNDTQDLVVTGVSSTAMGHLNDFIHQALSYGRDAEDAIIKALIADPTCAIAHAYAAAYFLSQENARDRSQASHHLQMAQRYALQATQREQWYVQAIAAWAAGAINRSGCAAANNLCHNTNQLCQSGPDGLLCCRNCLT